MTLMMALFSSAVWASVTEPLSISRTHLHLAKQNPIYGDGAHLILETRRYTDETVHVLSSSATARPHLRRVISRSAAKTLEGEMSGWIKKIGASRGGLNDLGCTLPLRTEHAHVRASMCLGGLSPRDQKKFFDWYKTAADLAR